MHLGELQAIWRYPVKSLSPEALPSVAVGEDGIPGDRARALFVESGHARAGKTYRGKENNLLHLTDALERAVELANEKNVEVTVESGQAHYFDAAPISLIFHPWLDEASRLVGYELDPLRFRPNFFVHASKEFSGVERDLSGQVLHVGEVTLRVREPIERCVTTTYDQTTGEPDPNVLRAVAQHREVFMGIYCEVLQPGVVRIGDPVGRA